MTTLPPLTMFLTPIIAVCIYNPRNLIIIDTRIALLRIRILSNTSVLNCDTIKLWKPRIAAPIYTFGEWKVISIVRICAFFNTNSFWFCRFPFPLFLAWTFLPDSLTRITEHRQILESVSLTWHITSSSPIFLTINRFVMLLPLRRSHHYKSIGENRSWFQVRMTTKIAKKSKLLIFSNPWSMIIIQLI